ncbi:MAG: hypothetical protein LBQ43_02885 [Holosporales bacterium]|jgi:tetraacyldisaccharide-1-P 4'-kinase|nr:hypothetical protein [Holosporales bacterium]
MLQIKGKIAFFIRQCRKRCVIFVSRHLKESTRQKSRISIPIPIIVIDSVDKSTMVAEKMGIILTLAEQLTLRGHKPHVWSKGAHARQARLLTAPTSPNGINEEAFILSQKIPTWVCSSPRNAALAAAHAGATILLLNERSERDDHLFSFSVALVERNIGTNAYASNMLAKSDAIVSLVPENIQELKQVYRAVYSAKWSIPHQNITQDVNIFGFTGLHDSGAFYHSLLKHKYNIKGFIPLLHLQRQEKQLQVILKMASSSGGILVTSDKDAPFLSKKMKHQIHVFPMNLEVDMELVNLIEQAIDLNKRDVEVEREIEVA